MILTDTEKSMLSGEYGPGMQKMIDLLVKFGDVCGADRLVDVYIGHVSINAPTDFLDEMTEGVEKARIPICTTHPTFDPGKWKEYGIPEVSKDDSIGGGVISTDPDEIRHRIDICRRLGFVLTGTCTPNMLGIEPRVGDVIALGGPSSQILSNSLFAAKGNREGVFTAFASAITGKTPLMGLILDENRNAQVVAEMEVDFESATRADYGVLGYYIGGIAKTRNVAITGLPRPTTDQFRFLTSALSVSGPVSLCHVVGFTPEAPTLEVALKGKKPELTFTVDKKELEEAKEKLNSARSNEVNLVTFGCPHCSILEINEIAELLEGKKINSNVRLQVATPKPIYTWAKDIGYADIIEKAGGVMPNYCVASMNPLVYLVDDIKVVATNSSKAAHLIPQVGAGKVKAFIGDTKACINAAITGKWEGY